MIAIMDTVSVVACIFAVAFFVFRRQNLLSRDQKVCFSLLLFAFLANAMLDLAESTVSSHGLDLIEDYTDIVLPLVWGIFILSRVSQQPLPEERATDARTTFARQLVFGLTTLLVLNLVLGLSFFVKARDTAAQLQDYHGEAVVAVNDMHSESNGAIQESFAYVVSGEEVEKREFKLWARDFDADAAAFRSVARLDEPSEIERSAQFHRIVALQQSIVQRAERMFEEYEQNGRVSSNTFESYEEVIDEFDKQWSVLQSSEQDAYDTLQYAATERLADASIEMPVLGATTILLSAGLCGVLIWNFRGYAIQQEITGEELASTENRFRAIFNSTFQMIGLLDPKGTLLEANETALAFGDLQPEDVLNRPFWETTWWQGDEQRVEQLRDAIRRAAGGEFVRYTVDVDGARSIETIDFSIKPVFDDRGQVKMLLPEGRLFTEQKQAEQALQASEIRFRRIVEHAPEAVVMVDPKTGRFVLVNPAAVRLFKMSADELYRTGPIQLSPPTQPDGTNSAEKAREYIALAVAGKEPVFEWVHRDSVGDDIPCEIRLLSLEMDGQMVIQGSLIDISDRKRSQEIIQRQHELVAEELQKAKEELVLKTRLAAIGQVSAQIAHELRNPLGSVSNAIYYLKRHVPDSEEKWSEYLNLMDVEIAACNRFISDLLNVTRTKLPKQVKTSLNVLIDKVLSRHEFQTGVNISVVCEPNPFEIFADPDQILQVLDNLFKNAMEAIGDNAGTIEILAHKNGENDIIEIQDSGGGVSAEYRDSIFDVLFSTKATGTGLGLQICKQIIEKHDGSIELAGDASQRTKFKLRLPNPRQ